MGVQCSSAILHLVYILDFRISEEILLNDMAKNLVLWLVIAAVLFSVFQNFGGRDNKDELTYSQFVQEVQTDRIAEVRVDGQMIIARRTDNSTYTVVRPTLPMTN